MLSLKLKMPAARLKMMAGAASIRTGVHRLRRLQSHVHSPAATTEQRCCSANGSGPAAGGATVTAAAAAASSSSSVPAAAAAAVVASAVAADPRRQAASLTVREARPDEYDRVVAIVNAAFSHWASHRLDAQDGRWQRLTLEELREELAQGEKLGLDSELLVCVDAEGAICGTVLTNQWYAAEDFASAGRADTESFGQLAVAPEAQVRRMPPGILNEGAIQSRLR